MSLFNKLLQLSHIDKKKMKTGQKETVQFFACQCVSVDMVITHTDLCAPSI